MRCLIDSGAEANVLKVGLAVNRVDAETCGFPAVPDLVIDFDVDESLAPVRNAYVSIPAHFQEQANKRMEEMLRIGIIGKVLTSPLWLSGLSAIPKERGDFRLVVNMRAPNRAIRRQYRRMPRGG